jgi:hypothetical protein
MVTDKTRQFPHVRAELADAARLWRRTGLTAPESQVLAMVEHFSRRAEAKIGRNEVSWCGSGRKYRHCRLGSQ